MFLGLSAGTEMARHDRSEGAIRGESGKSSGDGEERDQARPVGMEWIDAG